MPRPKREEGNEPMGPILAENLIRLGYADVVVRTTEVRVTGTKTAESAGTAQATAVQSVDRAVTILEVLAQRGETGVSELAVTLGVHKSTAFRLLAALEERGLVEQNSERGKYQLGLIVREIFLRRDFLNASL